MDRSRSTSVPAGTTTAPSGLSSSLAIFATSFDVAMPTDAVSPPVTSWTRRFSSWAMATAPSWLRSSGSEDAAEIDERLVQRQRLDQRRHGAEHAP